MKFIQVTLIETAGLQDEALRMKLLNASFIKDVGLDIDYQTVIKMSDGTKHIVEEAYLELSKSLNGIRVGS